MSEQPRKFKSYRVMKEKAGQLSRSAVAPNTNLVLAKKVAPMTNVHYTPQGVQKEQPSAVRIAEQRAEIAATKTAHDERERKKEEWMLQQEKIEAELEERFGHVDTDDDGLAMYSGEEEIDMDDAANPVITPVSTETEKLPEQAAEAVEARGELTPEDTEKWAGGLAAGSVKAGEAEYKGVPGPIKPEPVEPPPGNVVPSTDPPGHTRVMEPRPVYSMPPSTKPTRVPPGTGINVVKQETDEGGQPYPRNPPIVVSGRPPNTSPVYSVEEEAAKDKAEPPNDQP